MFSTLISIIALGLIIMIHEFGHFLAARACGVGVIEFSIGMGPKLLSKRFGKTKYSLRALPFGGSCMMLSEEMEQEDGFDIDGVQFEKEEQFASKPVWKRFIIVAAGPVFNFILAFLLSIVIISLFGFDRPAIIDVTPGMPAAEAGLEMDDEIYRLRTAGDSTAVECARDISVFMTVHQSEMQAAECFVLYYKDASDGYAKKTAELIPMEEKESGLKRLGFSYTLANKKLDSVGQILHYSVSNVRYCIRSAAASLKMIFRGRVGREDVMGPVRMVAVMDESVDEAANYGGLMVLGTLLDIMILISGSLGCMNLLPVPALDGGRLVFILIELIIRRPVPKRFEARIHMLGMLLLLTAMFFILTNDVSLLLFR